MAAVKVYKTQVRQIAPQMVDQEAAAPILEQGQQLEALQPKAIQAERLVMGIMAARVKIMGQIPYALEAAVVQEQLVKMRQAQQRQVMVEQD
jgi:hypothetical protein